MGQGDRRILARNDAVLIFRHDDLLIVVPGLVPTPTMLTSIQEALEHSVSAATPKLALLFVVGRAVQPPNAAVRRQVAKLFGHLEEQVAAMATVFEGEGMRVAIKRSVFTAVSGLLGRKIPRRVFASTLEALHWLGQESPRYGLTLATAQELKEAIDSLRARHALEYAGADLE